MADFGRSSRPDTIMVSHPSMMTLAEKVKDLISNSSGSQKRFELRRDINWQKFDDGYPNIFIERLEEYAGRHVVFIGSFSHPAVIFEQLSVLYALPKSSIRSLTFILPFFPTGTMERVDHEGQIATAMTMARLLSATPLSAMGPTQLLTFDIHALQERFYFSDNLIPRLVSAIPQFLQVIKNLSESDVPIAIAFPDEGAHKRFNSYFKDYPIIRCIKKRRGEDREITIVDGDATDHHVIIVDDLINTGGTVMKCISCMKSANAKKVSVYVTHPVFPKDSWRKFVSPGNSSCNLDTFWITDSLPQATDIVKHPPFKLISLANIICNAIGMS